MAKKRIVLSHQYDCLTFKKLLAEYIDDCRSRGLTQTSIISAEQHLRPVTKYIDADTPVADIDFKHLYGELYARTDISPNTIAGYLTAVKSIVRYANKAHGYNIPVPVIKHVETIKETYTDEELIKLVTKKKCNTFAEYRTWLCVCVLVDTGIRASTLRNILIKDIDFDRYSLATRHNKTKKVQVVPLSPQLCKDIRIYLNTRKGKGDDFLFCDVYGNQLSDNALKLAIIRYNKSRGVEKHGIHMFRHTFARKFILNGGDALILQRQLGHSTLEMTKHYVKLYNTDLFTQTESQLDSLIRHKIHL